MPTQDRREWLDTWLDSKINGEEDGQEESTTGGMLSILHTGPAMSKGLLPWLSGNLRTGENGTRQQYMHAIVDERQRRKEM
jgi:hypothetical protein